MKFLSEAKRLAVKTSHRARTSRYSLDADELAMFASAHVAAQNTPGVLRVSAIPDEAPTELQRKFKPLGDYLGARA